VVGGASHQALLMIEVASVSLRQVAEIVIARVGYRLRRLHPGERCNAHRARPPPLAGSPAVTT
jgi:hypothetical protein